MIGLHSLLALLYVKFRWLDVLVRVQRLIRLREEKKGLVTEYDTFVNYDSNEMMRPSEKAVKILTEYYKSIPESEKVVK